MPKATLEKLPYDKVRVKNNSIIVRAFNGSKMEVMGELEIPVQIGPFIFQISFQVMDIRLTYSCLLGRPWIHAAGVVPSSLHQKLKFIVDNELVIISREEDLLISFPQLAGYIEAAEEALKTTFQSLEITNTTLVKKELKKGKILKPMMAAIKMMIKKGFRVGQGLCKNLNGIPKPIELRGITNLCENFINKANQVEEASTKENSPESLINPCSSREEPKNWAIQELSMTCANDIISRHHHFNNIVNQTNGEDTSQEPPSELKQLIELEDKIILRYQEETETINIGFNGEVKKVKVGIAMCSDDKRKLIQLLTEYVDILHDMPGLYNEIVEHKIPLEPSYPPVKQKLRRMSPETSLKIKEVKKQLEAEFFIVAKYLQWVANIVPVPKNDGKVKMCVDYKDLNRANPKDDFPLPHIDVLVDNTPNMVAFPSWMDSLDTIKLGWPRRTWRKLLLSPNGGHFATK
ncbi:hypothetical protein CR513_23260, partial [Mucuna pruriens]